jgi:hypothetical protein
MSEEVLPDFDPSGRTKYTPQELEAFADQWLEEREGKVGWKSRDELRNAKRKEIHNETGTPDPSIVAGLYWRIYPKGGRKHRPNRKTHEGFYR